MLGTHKFIGQVLTWRESNFEDGGQEGRRTGSEERSAGSEAAQERKKGVALCTKLRVDRVEKSSIRRRKFFVCCIGVLL